MQKRPQGSMFSNISCETPYHGAHRNSVRPTIDKNLFPGYGAGLMIVLSEELQVKYVDHIVVVQIGGGGRGGVIAHANSQGVELIDHIVIVNVARQKSDLGHRGRSSTRQVDRTFSTEESTGRRKDRISSRSGRETERAIRVRVRGSDKAVVRGVV